MKKDFIKGFLAGALIFSVTSAAAFTAYTAYKADFPILIDGEKFTSDKPIVTIDGSTYLPLKALGDALDINVSWDEKRREVNISKYQPIENDKKIALTDRNGFFLGLYEGSARNGSPEGFGSLYMYDKNTYDGIFDDGNINGSGTLTYKADDGSDMRFNSTFLWDADNKDLLMYGPTMVEGDNYVGYCDYTWLPIKNGRTKVVPQGIGLTLHNVKGVKSIFLTEYGDNGEIKAEYLYTLKSKTK